MMRYLTERSEIVYFMRRLYRQKLTTTSGGNISLRVSAEIMAITPAALDKGRLCANQVALIAMNGESLTPEIKPTSETRMHLRIYELCPHVSAIIHAHPVTATAFTAASTPIRMDILAEPYALVGQPVTSPYALTGTLELAEVVAQAAVQANCVLMRNHGLLTLGKTLLEAYDRLELIEVAAQTTLLARQLDGVQPLTREQLDDLDRLMGRK
jgi:L-fuculose-phosphate aldolase